MAVVSSSSSPVQAYVAWLLPAGAWLLLLLLAGVSPWCLLALKQQLLPLLGQADVLLKGSLPNLPLYYYLKLCCFVALSVLSLGQILLRLQVLYHTAWARYFPRPHPLHCDFHPSPQYSMPNLLRWHVYRGTRLLGLPLGLLAACTLWYILQVTLLTSGMDSPLLQLPLPYMVGCFVSFTLGLVTLIALGYSTYSALASCYGTVAAITEPLKPPATLFARSVKICLKTPLTLVYWGCALAYGLALLAAVTCWLVFVDLPLALSGQVPWWQVLVVEALLWVGACGLGWLRVMAYHEALRHYYDQLPSFVKGAFQSPPSLVTPLP